MTRVLWTDHYCEVCALLKSGRRLTGWGLGFLSISFFFTWVGLGFGALVFFFFFLNTGWVTRMVWLWYAKRKNGLQKVGFKNKPEWVNLETRWRVGGVMTS